MPRFPVYCSPTTNRIEFVDADLHTLRTLTAHDRRFTPSGPRRTASLAEVVRQWQGTPPTRHLAVLHHGFCCSTLLARCLRTCVPGYSEPAAINSLLHEARALGEPGADRCRAALTAILAVLGTTDPAASPWFVKYSDDALDRHGIVLAVPEVFPLFLYTAPEEFALSVATRGSVTRWAADRLGVEASEFGDGAGVAELALRLWLLRARTFLDATSHGSVGATLSTSDFLADPARTVRRLTGRWPDPDTLDTVLSRDAKRPDAPHHPLARTRDTARRARQLPVVMETVDKQRPRLQPIVDELAARSLFDREPQLDGSEMSHR